ncbi:ADP-glyceromanno-heptose 6-epimerase [Methylophilaceae bacterium]|jgi:ADP-L-glycero-D-manno-heptose 6-epimerase|nr:ADP-glyceromanno-heptose 6-epimerase [Methylophilaceae bacterium]|tara:strand:+ start:2925 stop:3908 length:984 start_codon:yes stop_codon:yes gene_type:complete
MIILTGGAGMIGSMVAWHLNNEMNFNDFVIVDDLVNEQQEYNFNKRDFVEYIKKDDLKKYLNKKQNISAVIHMGAISATTESNFNRLLESNIRFSQQLWHWCAKNKVPFIYASSAATYGDGSFNYNDNESELDQLNPLNAYGYSKHFFDRWIQLELAKKQPAPPQWCGLKFFNVYGPNEYHKDRMASVVFHAFNQYKESKQIKLFKSEHPSYKDGMQVRDFIYVKDAVKVIIFFLNNSKFSGVYNVGTGNPETFKALAEAVLSNNTGNPDEIKYINMPNDLKGKYQYYTKARIDKIRSIGFGDNFKNLNEGVTDYLKNYLLTSDRYA